MSVTSALFIFVLFFVIFISASIKSRDILILLVIAFCVRILLSYMDFHGFISLPYGRSDAVNFSDRAMQWYTLPANQFFLEFNPRGSYVYSWIAAAIYKIFGPDEMVLRSLNAFLGTYAILISWLLVGRVTGLKPSSKKLFYFASFFPPFLFMSCVTMREMFIIVPFMLGLYSLSKWVNGKKSFDAISGGFWLVISGMFHGAMVMGVLGFLMFALYSVVKTGSGAANGNHVSLKSRISSMLIILIVFSVALASINSGVVLSSGIDLGRQADMAGLTESIEERFGREERGDSAYPAFVRGDPFSKPYLFPVRYVYFLFSPFPWDVRSLYQALGMISSFFFAYAFIYIYPRRKSVDYDGFMMLLVVFLFMAFVFSVGTHNIGTAVRHRTKFFLLLVVLMSIAGHVKGSKKVERR